MSEVGVGLGLGLVSRREYFCSQEGNYSGIYSWPNMNMVSSGYRALASSPGGKRAGCSQPGRPRARNPRDTGGTTGWLVALHAEHRGSPAARTLAGFGRSLKHRQQLLGESRRLSPGSCFLDLWQSLHEQLCGFWILDSRTPPLSLSQEDDWKDVQKRSSIKHRVFVAPTFLFQAPLTAEQIFITLQMHQRHDIITHIVHRVAGALYPNANWKQLQAIYKDSLLEMEFSILSWAMKDNFLLRNWTLRKCLWL